MENKKFYVTIKGKQIEVTEAVYREYIRPMRVERSRRLRAWRCKVLGPKGNLVRCTKSCRECPYAQAGFNPKGNNLSLDEFRECGIEIIDNSLALEEKIIEEETKNEKLKKLSQALKKLTPRQQEMVKMIYFDGKTQGDLAKHYGVGKQAISNAMQRIYATLKKNL